LHSHKYREEFMNIERSENTCAIYTFVPIFDD